MAMAISAFLRQCFEDGPLNVFGQVWIELCWRMGVLALMLYAEHVRVRSVEGFVPGEELIGNAAQGIQVALQAHETIKLFRCHVKSGADNINRLCACCFEHGRDIKISKQGLVTGVKENVFGL